MRKIKWLDAREGAAADESEADLPTRTVLIQDSPAGYLPVHGRVLHAYLTDDEIPRGQAHG